MTIAPEGSEEGDYLESARQAVSALDELAAAVQGRGYLFLKKTEQAGHAFQRARDLASAGGGDAEKRQLRDAAAEAMKLACEAQVLAGAAGSKLDEWKECRSTIDRFDKLLVDLRKTGFGFVTALVGAATFVFANDVHLAPRVCMLWMLVLLICTLYLIDLAHQTWLGIAVDRAKELEKGLRFSITTDIGARFPPGQASWLAFFMYFMLLLATGAFFYFSISRYTADWDDARLISLGLAMAVGVIVMGAANCRGAKAYVPLREPSQPCT